MSRFDPTSQPDLAASIDHLVANELGDDDRRALLLRLEATPDGWRTCALAFLEDQAWRTALIGPLAETVGRQTPKTTTPPRRRKVFGKIGRYVVAASLFGGFAAVGFRAGVASVERPQHLDVASKPPVVEPRPDSPFEPGKPLGWVSLVDPAEGEALPRRVPILAATESNERWVREQPATIPDYVRAQWERRGYQVEEHHRLVGLDLKDGRHVAIPVNEVALDFVGRQPL